MVKPLKLQFAPSSTALASTNGVLLIYRVWHDTIDWICEIEADGRLVSERAFTSKTKAQAYARADFRRRQIVRAVA